MSQILLSCTSLGVGPYISFVLFYISPIFLLHFDRMVVGFTTTYAISAYHHWCCQFESRIRTRCTTLCDKVCQWLATGRWFSLRPPVSSTNKNDCHDITEVLLKVTCYMYHTKYIKKMSGVFQLVQLRVQWTHTTVHKIYLWKEKKIFQF